MMVRKPNAMVQLKLRFSERLRVRLKQAAAETNNSLNSEIVRRLEHSFLVEDIVAEVGKVMRGMVVQ